MKAFSEVQFTGVVRYREEAVQRSTPGRWEMMCSARRISVQLSPVLLPKLKYTKSCMQKQVLERVDARGFADELFSGEQGSQGKGVSRMRRMRESDRFIFAGKDEAVLSDD